MTRGTEATRRLSRRRFMGLLTAAAAGAALPVTPAAAAVKKKRTAAPAGPPPGGFTEAERKEIVRLGAQIDEALAKVRAFPLPAGAPPASAFAVMVRARRVAAARPARGGRP